MSKALTIISIILSTTSCLAVIATFLYFNHLNRQYTNNIESYKISQEQWKTEFTKWRDDISGYVSSLYERYPTNINEQNNLPVGIGL